MPDNWEGQGYDAEASSGGGLWLRLRTRGERVRLRLCSTACRYTQVFKDQSSGADKIVRRAAWLCIHKEILNGQPLKTVRVFQGGPMIYGLIKDLAESDDWGDPTQYDITIERTEEQGRYYVVTPVRKPFGPITDEERQMLKDAAVDWPAVCKSGSTVAAEQQTAGEHDPFADDE